MSKKILMIAGPNGAGKTTMTLELITNRTVVYECINADEIAKGLAPLRPESMALTASKLMIKRLKDLLDANKSFAFETTASGKNYIKYLHIAKENGYKIHITFLWLASPEEAIKRVAQREKQGGHSVKRDTITRRYYTGIKNFFHYYLPLANTALVLDNSFEGPSRKLIARKKKNSPLHILDQSIWEKMETIVHG